MCRYLQSFRSRYSCIFPNTFKDCAVLTPPAEGAVDRNSGTTVIGGTATYTCNNGFVVTGTAVSTCTVVGWDTAAPSCGRYCCSVHSLKENKWLDKNKLMDHY
ncbi:hypothetical protein DPMN_051753 [Dreissena polymorpha]|uniref:Sushi domain-containing protein n=1 Tax=Dreissena polymorpha TaxID=45954 RepID=A0A9D4CKD2_DREPO|nr:hypothetical protein DPMN_051753 [Dreissena polymorpha]